MDCAGSFSYTGSIKNFRKKIKRTDACKSSLPYCRRDTKVCKMRKLKDGRRKGFRKRIKNEEKGEEDGEDTDFMEP